MMFSEPVMSFRDFFFIRADINASSLDEMKGKRVAMIKDFVKTSLVREKFPDIQVLEFETAGEAIDSVLEGEAELLFDTYLTIQLNLQKDNINNIVPFKSARDLGTFPVHMATRTDLPHLNSILKKSLAAMNNGRKQAIIEKWIILNDVLSLNAEEKAWIKANPKIAVGGMIDWPPYDYADEKGRHAGISEDY